MRDDTPAGLPANGIVRVYLTGDRVTPESAADGMPAEMGWVDARDMTCLYPSRNDVRPLWEYEVCDIDAETLEELRDDISRALGSYVIEWGTGTAYGQDAATWDYTSDSVYLYAAHAHVKFYDGTRGWVEDEVDLSALTDCREGAA